MNTITAGVLEIACLDDGAGSARPGSGRSRPDWSTPPGGTPGRPAADYRPAVTLDWVQDPLKPGGTAGQAKMFTARHEHRVIAAGHNLPQEAPEEFADAVLTVQRWLDQG